MNPETRRTLVAWLVIVACAVAVIADQRGSDAAVGSEKISVRVAMRPDQRVFLRMADAFAAPDADPMVKSQLSGIEAQLQPVDPERPGDAVGQAVVLARIGELDAARELVESLHASIADGRVEAEPREREAVEAAVTAIAACASPSADALSDAQAEVLAETLGEGGHALVAMARGDRDALGARSLVGAGAMLVLALIAVAAIGLGLGGLAAIGVFAVLAGLGRVRGAGPPAVGRASVHAEVFAAWMVSYFAANRGIGWAVDRIEAWGMPRPSTEAMLALTLVVDAAALAFALWWGTRRGLTWRTLRAQVGLTPPRASDVLWGVVTYAMGIVFLAVGIGLALVLSALFGEGGFGGVSHPIQGLIADGSALGVFLSFVLAAVAAPIGEEIAFRGALYRNLRDTFGRTAPFVGALVATVAGSMLFAAIHPQGFIFIPVLGGLAVAFCISREWTGSINPAIVAHAINNAVMVGLNVVLLR